MCSDRFSIPHQPESISIEGKVFISLLDTPAAREEVFFSFLDTPPARGAWGLGNGGGEIRLVVTSSGGN